MAKVILDNIGKIYRDAKGNEVKAVDDV